MRLIGLTFLCGSVIVIVVVLLLLNQDEITLKSHEPPTNNDPSQQRRIDSLTQLIVIPRALDFSPPSNSDCLHRSSVSRDQGKEGTKQRRSLMLVNFAEDVVGAVGVQSNSEWIQEDLLGYDPVHYIPHKTYLVFVEPDDLSRRLAAQNEQACSVRTWLARRLQKWASLLPLPLSLLLRVDGSMLAYQPQQHPRPCHDGYIWWGCFAPQNKYRSDHVCHAASVQSRWGLRTSIVSPRSGGPNKTEFDQLARDWKVRMGLPETCATERFEWAADSYLTLILTCTTLPIRTTVEQPDLELPSLADGVPDLSLETAYVKVQDYEDYENYEDEEEDEDANDGEQTVDYTPGVQMCNSLVEFLIRQPEVTWVESVFPNEAFVFF